MHRDRSQRQTRAESSHSRVDPRNNHQTLDDVAPVKRVGRLGAVNLVGEGGERRGADDEEDESDDDGDEVGEDTEDDGLAGDVEADGEED